MDRVLLAVVCCGLVFVNVVVNGDRKGKPRKTCGNTFRGIHKSCADVYDKDTNSASGKYEMKNAGQTFEVYCDFYEGIGYTYIPESALGRLPPLSVLSNDRSHVIIRLLDDQNHQYAVTIQQLSTYALQYPLSFQLNPQNSTLGSYLYVDTLPTELTTLSSSPLTGRPPVQGYNAGGMDTTFTNCDRNGSAYFALFYNENNATQTRRRNCVGKISDYITKVNEVPSSRHLPLSYFETLEVHYDGCGRFALSSDIPHINGASIGLPFVTEPRRLVKK